MKRKQVISAVTLTLVTALTTIPMQAQQQPGDDKLPSVFVKKPFTVNLQDSDITDVLNLIGRLGGVKVDIDTGVSGKVTMSLPDTNLAAALDAIVRDQGLAYTYQDGVLYVEKPAGGKAAEGGGGVNSVRTIEIRNASAAEIKERIQTSIFKPGETLVVDETSNTLVFYGSDKTMMKVREFVDAFDRFPLQVSIEAQIVETSRNFARDIGFKWGDMSTEQALGKSARATGSINTGLINSPTANGKVVLGFIDGRILEAQLAAAESNGDARVISRPKVVTLNNQTANINSGVTFNVKTLSSTTTSTPQGGTNSATGGLTEVKAGLQLQVRPVVVGEDLVRLKIALSNSEPSESLAVDGIPGIVDNSADTTIIVNNGQTVSMAGLLKSSLSKSSNRVPLLSSIPVLGWLFTSHSDKDRNNELVIFITPSIIREPKDFAGRVMPLLNAPKNVKPPEAVADRLPASESTKKRKP